MLIKSFSTTTFWDEKFFQTCQEGKIVELFREK